MSKGVSQYQKSLSELRRMKRDREEREFMKRERLAKRDLDYAENSSPVTIEERDGKITEWRGPRVIGCRSADYISHS